MKTFFYEKERVYTGPELRPHFLLEEFGLKGTTLAAFCGPCEVKTEALVDWEDRLAQDVIRSASMVHFLAEFFGAGLRETVFLQRLWIAALAESLQGKTSLPIRRKGDDIFVDSKKLTVSIVTASPVSTLMHIGVNIDPAGAPVSAIGLQELKINPQDWIGEALERLRAEWEGVDWACAKVRPVM
jgi:uncharacterized protein